MNEPKFTRGGRGLKAPYQTTHVRLPETLKPYLEEIIEEYKQALEKNRETEFLHRLTKTKEAVKNHVNILSKQDLLGEADRLVRARRSAKISLEKLLTIILEEEIKL